MPKEERDDAMLIVSAHSLPEKLKNTAIRILTSWRNPQN